VGLGSVGSVAFVAVETMGGIAPAGDFDINLDVVWDTVQTALPQLVQKLSALQLGPDTGRRRHPQ
jgi:uncharacterized protein with HEPN domain